VTQPAFGPYSTVVPKWANTLPSWVPDKHKARIASYQVYQEIYWSHVNASYKVMNRGLDQDDEPLYVPSSRIIIDTMNRYVGNDLTFAVESATGNTESQLAATEAFRALFARERFASKYAANKRNGLIKADWLWHLVADPEKEDGRRISILTVQPESYFPTYEDEVLEGGDPERLVQVRLVELVQVGDDTLARVQLYDRMVDEAGTIYSSLTLWKQEEWFDPEKVAQQTLVPPAPLPAGITTIPVYHIPNGLDLDNPPYGSSEMRGLEVLQAGLNQGVTDEDIALAMMGLGLYATDQPGGPTDKSGAAVDWFVYPGAIIQNAKGLHRVEGITTVAPYNDHLGRLEGYMADASGATDAARGRLEVSEAESGIALQLKLAPTLAKAKVSDQVILDVHNQMFYDLVTMWFPTFESLNFTDVTVVAVLGDKLPVNRAAEVEMVLGMVVAGLMSAASGRAYLTKKGFGDLFDPNEAELVLAEKVATAAAEGGSSELDGRAATENETEADPNADA
jgi:hypothetical protein